MRHETAAGRTIHFVPGLSIIGADGVPDVIRGEETQIIGEVGACARPPPARPARARTASGRWSRTAGIVWFATFMTGELFGVLKEHSILGRLMAGEARRRGCLPARSGLRPRRARRAAADALFSARTLGLFGQLPASAIGAYLSGLLIGSEIAEALDCLEEPPSGREITVIGSSDLTGRYLTAIEDAGLRGRRAAPDAAARGLFLIARAAGLVR